MPNAYYRLKKKLQKLIVGKSLKSFKRQEWVFKLFIGFLHFSDPDHTPYPCSSCSGSSWEQDHQVPPRTWTSQYNVIVVLLQPLLWRTVVCLSHQLLNLGLPCRWDGLSIMQCGQSWSCPEWHGQKSVCSSWSKGQNLLPGVVHKADNVAKIYKVRFRKRLTKR